MMTDTDKLIANQLLSKCNGKNTGKAIRRYRRFLEAVQLREQIERETLPKVNVIGSP